MSTTRRGGTTCLAVIGRPRHPSWWWHWGGPRRVASTRAQAAPSVKHTRPLLQKNNGQESSVGGRGASQPLPRRCRGACPGQPPRRGGKKKSGAACELGLGRRSWDFVASCVVLALMPVEPRPCNRCYVVAEYMTGSSRLCKTYIPRSGTLAPDNPPGLHA